MNDNKTIWIGSNYMCLSAKIVIARTLKMLQAMKQQQWKFAFSEIFASLLSPIFGLIVDKKQNSMKS